MQQSDLSGEAQAGIVSSEWVFPRIRKITFDSALSSWPNFLLVTSVATALEGSNDLSTLDISKWMATYDSKMYPVNPHFILDACLDRSSVDVSRHASSGSIQMCIQDKMRIQWIHFRVVSSHPFGYSFGSIQR